MQPQSAPTNSRNRASSVFISYVLQFLWAPHLMKGHGGNCCCCLLFVAWVRGVGRNLSHLWLTRGSAHRGDWRTPVRRKCTKVGGSVRNLN